MNIQQKPCVSVVMSAFNAETYLDEAITSILNQTLKNFEFIIINDGSVDNTGAIIKKYAGRDKRVVAISQGNQGLIASLNTGIKAAKGRYIARMDADDLSDPNRLQIQFEYLEKNPEMVMLGSLAAFINKDSRVTGIWPFLFDDNEIRTGMISHSQFCHGSVMMRRSVIVDSNEFYNPKAVHYEDYELWPRLLSHGSAANLPKILYYYRQTDTNITSVNKLEMEAGSKIIRANESKYKYKMFKIHDVITTLTIAKTYKPAHFVINGKKFATNLRSNYISYLIGRANVYALHRNYVPICYILLSCILINPFQTIRLVTKKLRDAH